MRAMRKLGIAVVTALATVALTVGPASADTQLHDSHVGATSATFTQECNGDEGLAPGQVLWHFVLVQTTAVNTGQLTATFQNAGTVTVSATKLTGKTLHFNVITDGPDTLLGAVTTADGGQLNLSHVCNGDVPEKDARLKVVKWYDQNANGVIDPGIDQILPNWLVGITDLYGTVDMLTTVDMAVVPGAYTVEEYYSLVGNWTHSGTYVNSTTANSANPVDVKIESGGTGLVEFLNYCTVPSGGSTLGFWSNKNGASVINAQALLPKVLALPLVKADGSPLGTVPIGTFQKYLTSASATNMANMLSAQLAATFLNVASGKTDGGAYVIGYGGTINSLIADAIAALQTNPKTFDGPDRVYQETLKNYLDAINNGGPVIPTTPCDYQFTEPVMPS